MATYAVKLSTTVNRATLTEQHLYGASRLGMRRIDNRLYENGTSPNVIPDVQQNTLGNIAYEITNYLGNVNVVISDRKIWNATPTNAFKAVILSKTDYFPFGMLNDTWFSGTESLSGVNPEWSFSGTEGEISSRTTSSQEYRYGYNGMEMDNEAKGEGNSYTTEFRQYDPRIGRWLSLDPLMAQFPWQSPYCAFDNNPVFFTDNLGLSTETTIVGKNGKVIDVINDGKTDIVQFNDADETEWKGKGKEFMETGKGKVVGQTIFWHDFMKTKDETIYEFTEPAYGEKVLNNSLNIGGDYFNGSQIAKANIKMFKDNVNRYDYNAMESLVYLAMYSRNHKIFDLKSSLGFSRYTGICMNANSNSKVYTSLRVLGNIVFGANMEIARQQATIPMDKSEFWKTSMVYVGEYNMKQNNVKGKLEYPYYGEHIMSGRSVWLGYWGSKYKPSKMGFWEEVNYKTKNAIFGIQKWGN